MLGGQSKDRLDWRVRDLLVGVRSECEKEQAVSRSGRSDAGAGGESICTSGLRPECFVVWRERRDSRSSSAVGR